MRWHFSVIEETVRPPKDDLSFRALIFDASTSPKVMFPTTCTVTSELEPEVDAALTYTSSLFT